jgi:hypothetical protein
VPRRGSADLLLLLLLWGELLLWGPQQLPILLLLALLLLLPLLLFLLRRIPGPNSRPEHLSSYTWKGPKETQFGGLGHSSSGPAVPLVCSCSG